MHNQPYKFSVAPMMNWTDRHCRFFHRLLTKRALLYSEMLTSEAIVFGDRTYLLDFTKEEHPIALQIGGSNPDNLAKAAYIGENEGYDEINLNVGCPSSRVQSGYFGARLMAEPELVGDCVSAMQAAVNIPVTVKCRIGIDNQYEEEDFRRFIDVVAEAGCKLFIIHARKAWLKGLSPKENRYVPAIDYHRVYRLKAARPDLTIVINGEIRDHDAAKNHLNHVDGVMIGRAAYQTPFMLADVDQRYFDEPGLSCSRETIIELMLDYIKFHISTGGRLRDVVRHMFGLYHGQPGARAFRRYIAENSKHGGVEVLAQAKKLVSEPV
ncbi:MAG TPA: tRNA-dihydrouridine(20/20a) synthase [Hyphomicrobiaceae bacterium MAG_BT-2024]